MKKCRVCKIDLDEDYGVYENSDNQRRYYCFKHWKTYYLSNELIERNIQIKEWEIERDEVLRECVKLAKLVEELRDAIEEPKELDDK